MNDVHPWSMVISTVPDEGAEEVPMFNDGTPMTKEEFLEGIQEAAQDLADPDGEFNSMVRDFREGEAEVRSFDPVMADKIVGIVQAFEGFSAYIRERSELMTAASSTKTGS